MSLDLLSLLGAEPVRDRVVRDGNRMTGAGVTAGIDFGLAVAAELFGPTIAQRIQLAIEYAPAPPFESGAPDSAPDDICSALRRDSRDVLQRRRALVEAAARRLR
jgi:cyclohexyl-isocyanide hydratase